LTCVLGTDFEELGYFEFILSERKDSEKILQVPEYLRSQGPQLADLKPTCVWWVDLCWCPSSPRQQHGGANMMKKLVGKDKDRETTHQLPSRINQSRLGEIN